MATKKKESQEVVKVSHDLPDFLQTYDGGNKGLEKVNQADLIIPRLSLAQKMSPQIDKSMKEYIPGLEEGMFFNSVDGTIYSVDESGDEVPIKFVPILLNYSAIKWEKDERGKSTGEIVCRSNDGIHCNLAPNKMCECRTWVGRNRPECDLVYNFLCFLPEFDNTLVVWSTKITGAEAAKKLLSIANTLVQGKQVPFFAKQYLLDSAAETGSQGAYRVPTVTVNGFVSSEQFAFANDLYEMFKEKGVKVHEDDETPEVIADDEL
jgi:hypothetical protein